MRDMKAAMSERQRDRGIVTETEGKRDRVTTRQRDRGKEAS